MTINYITGYAINDDKPTTPQNWGNPIDSIIFKTDIVSEQQILNKMYYINN